MISLCCVSMQFDVYKGLVYARKKFWRNTIHEFYVVCCVEVLIVK